MGTISAGTNWDQEVCKYHLLPLSCHLKKQLWFTYMVQAFIVISVSGRARRMWRIVKVMFFNGCAHFGTLICGCDMYTYIITYIALIQSWHILYLYPRSESHPPVENNIKEPELLRGWRRGAKWIWSKKATSQGHVGACIHDNGTHETHERSWAFFFGPIKDPGVTHYKTPAFRRYTLRQGASAVRSKAIRGHRVRGQSSLSLTLLRLIGWQKVSARGR